MPGRSLLLSVGYLTNIYYLETANAPRWLISKGRSGDAVRSLERVRPSEDVAAGHCQAEADAIQDAITNKAEKGPWLDLFVRFPPSFSFLRFFLSNKVIRSEARTSGELELRQWFLFSNNLLAKPLFLNVCATFLSYILKSDLTAAADSPRFYISLGLGEHAFDYNIASAVVGWAGVVIGMFLIDTTGRRNLLIWGAVLQALFLFVMAGLGNKSNPSKSDADGLVASVMLFNLAFSGYVCFHGLEIMG